MKVSIIISFYERLAHLKCCLDTLSLCEEDFIEVVVADDGSSENIVSELNKVILNYRFPIIHVWQPKEGFRLAASRNNGIKNSTGDYLNFLDCDFLVLPGAIKRHKEVAKHGRYVAGFLKYLTAEQSLALLKMEISPERLESLYRQLPNKTLIREHHRFIRYVLLRKLRLANIRKMRLSSHFSIHRRDMEYINGYDENFIGWGGEDEDMACRLEIAGFQGYSIMKDARLLHLWHPKALGNKHWKEGPNINYLNRRNIPFFCENGLKKK